MMNNYYSDFLFARPSFWRGMARMFDFAGTLNEYNTSLTPEQADEIAFRADRRAVAEDYRQVARRLARTR